MLPMCPERTLVVLVGAKGFKPPTILVPKKGRGAEALGGRRKP
jgi:hypothetical protein